MPAELGQEFLDSAVLRVKKVTPRRARVRAWIGSGFLPVDRRWPEPGQRSAAAPSPPLVEAWEPEPPEPVVVWIELRRRRFLFPERELTGSALGDTSATEVLEELLERVQDFLPEVRACEARVEVGSEEIRWWYERDGKPVFELEPLPLDLLSDEPGEGEGGSDVREPRRPSPNAPPAPDAIDPAA